MVRVGKCLATEGWTLRSGGAEGSDSAFEKGAISGGGLGNIYLPWEGFEEKFSKDGYLLAPNYERYKEARSLVKDIHPCWGDLSRGEKALHTRNIFEVVGHTLTLPSKFVVYWAPVKKGLVKGGTATAVHFAKQVGVETFNLNNPDDRERIELWLKTKWIP